jgi:two-component system, chemotaxis family, protein-glutamate methylesterase/glutaminase
MPERDVVIIGASAGGIPALRLLLAGLPAGLPASVLVVVHTRAGTDRLPDVLARFGPLPAAYAVSGQRLTPGLVTVAPPGQHLVITGGEVLRLHPGPLVHGTRPAIDPLLHSAAEVCGNRVTAVVLSGLLRDGAHGAAAVSAAGGSVLVQDPADACSPAMPRAALDRVPGAGVWPAAKLGWAIAEQVAAPAPPAIAPQFQPPYVKGIDEALWLAVSQLQMHAAAEQRLEQRFNASSLIAAQTRTSAARALHAADLITRHVLPLFQAGPLDSRYPAATAGRPY